MIEYAPSSPAAAYAAPTPVSEYVAPTPAAHAAELSRMNEEQLTVARAAAAESMAAVLAEADTALADLAAEALLLEEEHETQQAAKKKAKHRHKKR